VSKSFKNKIHTKIDHKIDHNTAFDSSREDLVSTARRMPNARMININMIDPDPEQPRIVFDEEGLKELGASIVKHGLLQPISVKVDEINNRFIILSGERRYRACKMVGIEEMACIIIEPEDKKDKFAKQIVENFIREDLSPVEKAYALMEYKNFLGEEGTWEDVEKALCISKTTRLQYVRILNLPDDIKNSIVNADRKKKGEITERHARSLIMLNKLPVEQKKLFDKIMNKNLTSEQTKDLARKYKTDYIAKTSIDKHEEKVFTFTITYKDNQDLISKLKRELNNLKKR